VGPLEAPNDQLIALEEGRAFADLSSWRKIGVSGRDARDWLNDLVSCDVATLEPFVSRRSLLLSATGRIRADLHVAADEEGFLLLQAPDQPEHVGLLLGPYVLSSDVSLRDRTAELSLFAVPGPASERVARTGLSPSVLGPGIDLVTPMGRATWRVEDGLLKHDLVEVGQAALEVRRVRAGIPRMGPDFGQEALPAEVGLTWAIDMAKGCFLGQESVARVRNLGHPPRVLRHLAASGVLVAGSEVRADARSVGEITSVAAAEEGGSVAIARIRWEAEGADLMTADGRELVLVGSMD
jgi:folate-binding protein YgfZ